MKLATLGPIGTYASIAANIYDYDIEKLYFRSINEVFKAVNEDIYAIIPYENSLDGFVQQSMDLLINDRFQIIDELYLPVTFSVVGNVNKEEEIKRIFVQFKAKGQCLNFINQFPNAAIMNTESNMISLEEVKKGIHGDVAIIPTHSYEDTFPFGIKDVTDAKNNQTRFLVIKQRDKIELQKEGHIKATIVVTAINDRPGMLYDILGCFYQKSINLVSIVSRPTKSEIGKYHFFIEIAFDNNIHMIEEAIEEIKKNNDLKIIVLGIYENKDQNHSN